MRIVEIIRDSEGEGDGQFLPKSMKGEPGTETEHRIVLTVQERHLLDIMESMVNAPNQIALDAYMAGAIIALIEVRGEVLRKLTDARTSKR